MPIAYVLINSEIGKEQKLLEELRKIKEVREAYFVYGVYDVVTKVEAETMDKLKEAVSSKIRRLEYVTSTLTMVVMEGT